MAARSYCIGILCFAVALIADSYESTAEAGFLKNGVRPGDRSRMHIVKRPTSGARKRIYAPGTRPEERVPGRRRGKQDYAWFWTEFDPGLGSATEARWNTALARMADRRKSGKGIVGAATMQSIMATYQPQISAAAARYGVSEALLTAVIAVESRGRPLAVSPAGAKGLMQLMPATARRFGVGNVFDEDQNVRGGASYLNWLLREFRGDVLLALAGYNAGEGAVKKHKGVPPYSETRDYVVQVMDAIAAMQTLCPGPITGPRTRCILPRPLSS